MIKGLLQDCQDNTAAARGNLIVENFIRNLPKMRLSKNWRAPQSWLLADPRSLQDPIILGAGWTLDDWRSDAYRLTHGDMVAVHGAAVALDMPVDWIVYVESMNLLDQMKRAMIPNRGWVIDLSSSPEVVDWVLSTANEYSKAVVWICDSSPYAAQTMAIGGLECLPYGSSALTAAAAFCRRNQWTPGVAGAPFCFGPSGRCYAQWAHWGQLKWELVDTAEGRPLLEFTGHPERESMHEAAGVPPIPRRRKCLEFKGYYTTADMLHQAKWFYDRDIETDTPLPLRFIFQDGQDVAATDDGWRATEIVNTARLGRLDHEAILAAVRGQIADAVIPGVLVADDAVTETLGLTDLIMSRRAGVSGLAALRSNYTILQAAIDRAEVLWEESISSTSKPSGP